MAQMVFAEEQAGVPVDSGCEDPHLALQEVLEKQLLPQPRWNRHSERSKAVWREGEISFEQTLEFQEWLVVEDNTIDALSTDAGFHEAELDGAPRKSRVVLPAAESLLLDRGDDLAVRKQGSRAVVIERGQAEHEDRVRKSCR